jgi:hypothetical protein
VTIVVASASSEGIALASDSRTTQRSGAHHRVASDNAQKVFAVGNYGIATYGTATIGPKTIRGLFDEWCASADAPGQLGIEDLADRLGTYFQGELNDATPAKRGKGASDLLPRTWPLGFLVAGYNKENVGRILEVRIRPDDCETRDTEVSTNTPTVLYRGQTSVLRRMILGVDLEEIRDSNIPLDGALKERLRNIRFELITPVTTQDAIDFSFFLVETTVLMQRFSDGTARDPRLIPGCGGPVQGLAIEPGGLRWIRRNELGAPARTSFAAD